MGTFDICWTSHTNSGILLVNLFIDAEFELKQFETLLLMHERDMNSRVGNLGMTSPVRAMTPSLGPWFVGPVFINAGISIARATSFNTPVYYTRKLALMIKKFLFYLQLSIILLLTSSTEQRLKEERKRNRTGFGKFLVNSFKDTRFSKSGNTLLW
jgi:hypothetical protein